MTDISYALFKRYLKGFCTPEEIRQIEECMVADPAYFDREMVQEFLLEEDQPLPADVEEQLMSLFRTLSAPARIVSPWSAVRSRYHFRLLRMAAAAVLLILAAGFVFFAAYSGYWDRNNAGGKYAGIPVRQWTASTGSQRRILLPDSSVVILFPGSRITLPENFNGSTRDVALQGRAWFDIARNARKPFRVHTPDLTTNVLGTSFEVDAADSARVIVNVYTGLVSISKDGKELARLPPDRQISFARTTGLYTIGEADTSGLCRWTSGELMFSKTPLPEICRTLQQWYGIPLSLDEKKWSHKKVSVTFEGQSIATVLQILSMTAGFRYAIQPDKIIIK